MRFRLGALTLEKLEAMTCVCSVGLDMIAIPGDTPATTISGMIADEMAIGMVNQKTTAVRVIPVIGKGVGETGRVWWTARLCTGHAGEYFLAVMISSIAEEEFRHRSTVLKTKRFLKKYLRIFGETVILGSIR